MFTGIVEELGTVAHFDGGKLRIRAATVLGGTKLGDSIAVNGCCLTVVDSGDDWWEADVSAETVARTSLATVQAGDPVNLERAVRVEDRLGGHIVQGHVDGVGEVIEPVPDLKVRVPDAIVPFLVDKGSITVDGVSLTVVKPAGNEFSVAVIPHTSAVTTLGVRKPGDPVNVEADVIAKYVKNLLDPYRS